MTRFIQLSRAQWFLVASFVGAIFPLILLITFMPAVSDWYAVTTLASPLERDLGFRAAVSAHPAFRSEETFFVTDVNRGGAFERAGVKVGDIPMDVHHGRSDFYLLLESHRGGSVEMRFLRISPGPTDAFPVQYRLTVAVPRSGER